MQPDNRSERFGICRDILAGQDAEAGKFGQHSPEIRHVARKDRFTKIERHFENSAL